MKKLKKEKNIKSSINILKVKTGSVKEFFANTRTIMRAADENKPIHKHCATLTFVDPSEMLRFLSATKLRLIHIIRDHPDSITRIAKSMHRKVSAVRRDVREMENFGIVRIQETSNPGHGKHKIVQLVAPTLKLEAYI